MAIGSKLSAAALLGGLFSMLVLTGTSGQQPAKTRQSSSAASTTSGAATPNRRAVQVQFPRTVPDGQGGWKTVYETRVEEIEQPVYSATAELSQKAQKLHAAEMEGANAARSFSEQLANAESDEQREELKAKLRDALNRQFDAQQERRTEEIASIEERLGKLKETLQKRDAAKEAIVGKRLDQLMGVKDELAWEETGALLVPVIPRAMNPNQNAARYAPGINPPVGTTIPLFAPGNPIVPAPPASPFHVIPTVPVPVGPALPVTPPPAPVPAAPALPAPPAPAAAPTAPAPREPGELKPSLELPAAAP